MTAPRFASGAKTAERVPSTTFASPRRTRHQASSRSRFSQPAVQQSDLLSESRKKQGLHRRGQRDLRHQHQGGPASLQAPGNQVEVDFCLPASRNAVQQDDAESSGIKPGEKIIEDVGLGGCQ